MDAYQPNYKFIDDFGISEIVFDSRKAVENSLYVAVKGTVSDGHSFIHSAIEKGAAAIVCEDLPNHIEENLTYIKVKNSSKTLGQLASNFYGNPSEKLELIGITGTNGKTSAATLLFDVFKNLGLKSALISTVEYRIGEDMIPSTHTTPDVIRLNQMLAKAVEIGCDRDIALAQSRDDALRSVGLCRYGQQQEGQCPADHGSLPAVIE